MKRTQRSVPINPSLRRVADPPEEEAKITNINKGVMSAPHLNSTVPMSFRAGKSRNTSEKTSWMTLNPKTQHAMALIQISEKIIRGIARETERKQDRKPN
jgi:hypothetical protein